MTLAFSGFEWDDGNREKSLRKHGITCEEAEEAFYNESYVYPDTRHSTETEKRYVLFGETQKNRIIFVSFTMRGKKIRVISARPMNQKEREWYEEEKKKSEF